MNYTEPILPGTDLPPDPSLEQIYTACHKLLCDLSYPTVRRWRDKGGKVMGHFQVYFPEELAHSADLLPLKLGCSCGNTSGGESHFGSYLCSLVKHSFGLAASGKLELDLFVTPSICDAARNLAVIWSRNFSCPVRTLYLPQNSSSPDAASYLLNEYRELVMHIEEISGKALDSPSIRRSVSIYNKSRRLMRQIYDIRSQTPWRLAVDECWLLIAVAGLLPRENHNRLLELALHGLAAQKRIQPDKIRVVIAGCFCEQPPLAMLEAVARSCHVVDDDMLIGLRWLKHDVEQEGEPIESLARAYCISSPPCPIRHSNRQTDAEGLLESAVRHGAQAVIIMAPKMCEPGLDVLVPSVTLLEQAGIPCCVCEFTSEMTSFELIELQVETFAENIMYAEPWNRKQP